MTTETTTNGTTEKEEKVPSALDAIPEGPHRKAAQNAVVFDACTWSLQDIQQFMTGKNKDKQRCVPLSSVSSPRELLQTQPMTLGEHLGALLFLTFGVPVGIFTIPVLVYGIGKFWIGDVKRTFAMFGLFVLLPSMILPQPFVPSVLHSWPIRQIVKYFSYRTIVEDCSALYPPSDSSTTGNTTQQLSKRERPRIYVAPPHGVFPYGNLLCMFTYPSMTGGRTFRGLASSTALKTPLFKNMFRSTGVIDASRNIARKVLEEDAPNYTIGLNTGGVAEVFESNAHVECIILRERIGLIKLAIRTGADLVPCYVFGNTQILHYWAGEGIPGLRRLLAYVSRKLGVALILIHGRFGLPIPHRIPVLSVMGNPIPTHHIQKEDPSDEEVANIQSKLIEEIEGLFDRYKGLYGWQDKKLIVK